jgi:hypothetical protein
MRGYRVTQRRTAMSTSGLKNCAPRPVVQHFKKAREFAPFQLALHSPSTSPVAMFNSANRFVVPCRTRFSVTANVTGSTDWVQSSACTCTCAVSSTNRATVSPGGSRYRPTMSATISANAKSFDNLKVPDRKGARQIQATFRHSVLAGFRDCLLDLALARLKDAGLVRKLSWPRYAT